MSLFMRTSSGKSPAAYLFEGLFPNLARYLAGGTRYNTKRRAQIDIPKDIAGDTTEEVLTVQSSSIEEGINLRTKAPSTPRQPLEIKSPSAKSRLDTTAHLSRSELSASFDIDRAKRLNRQSLPALALTHSRNVSTSSDETLVWSPNGGPTSTPPAASQVDQDLKDAAARVVRQKQAAEIRRLRQVISRLRRLKDSQTRRAEGIQRDLAVSEASRQTSLNMAIQYYKKQGNPFLVDLESLSERVEEMRRENIFRDNLIQDRNEMIDALGREINLYADRNHWILMQQRFYDLQQQYGEMPAALRSLERRNGDLQDDFDDLSNDFKGLEAELTVLRAQLSQVQDERDQLEYEGSTAERQLENAASRYRRMEIRCNEILDQKAEFEEQAEAKDRLLADLASRMFKRTIIMADMLDDRGVDPVDEELISLCQLAHEHLGLDAKDVYSDVEVAKAEEKRTAGSGEERGESGGAKAPVGTASSSATASNSNQQEPTVRLAGHSNISNINRNEGLESPNSYDARRRREVAAAEKAILGPLGLGFEDGSPTLKSMPVPEGSKSSKAPKIKNFLRASPATRKGLFTSGADEIDQVTPARTGGTGGIARDQWQIAADDLREMTEVFRGPRMHPVDVVSPEATDDEEGIGGDREHSPSYSEGGAFLSPNEGDLYEDDLVGEVAVEGGPILSSSSTKMPLAEGPRVFQDLEMGSESVPQEAATVPDLPKEAFKAPRFEDFNFGESSGAILFTGSENPSSALTAGTPASPSPGLFHLTSASTQAPVKANDRPPFEQNFNFGGNNTAVSFTASQKAPPCLPNSAPELESAAASSILGKTWTKNSPAVTAQAEDEVPIEEASDKPLEEDAKADVLSPNKQMKKKARAQAKKAQEKVRKVEERKEAALEAKGPNRNQGRAASRGRRGAEKKAQADAKKAQSAAMKAASRRRAVANAMMGV